MRIIVNVSSQTPASRSVVAQSNPRTPIASSLPVPIRIASYSMFSIALGINAKLRSGNDVSERAVVAPASASTTTDSQSQRGVGHVSLQEYISASPLLEVCGISEADVVTSLPRWKALGEQVAKNLKFPSFDQMQDFQRLRVYQYYLPVYFWCERQLIHHRNSGAKAPLVIGISAPQGCGKSTLCEQLEYLFTFTNRTAASISIDDFYLTHPDQVNLAATYPENPLLQMRGNAGSHDVPLGAATLRALVKASAPPVPPVPLPRYDKSAFDGKGDRADPATWPRVQGPIDVILFEGWMLGFRPVGAEAAAKVDPNLLPVDAALEEYKDAWDSLVDAWLVIKVGDPQCAYRWRLQAERAMRALGKAAMTDEQVSSFVDRFMPSYKCYLEGLYTKGPTTAATGKVLTVEVDEQRTPVAHQQLPRVQT